MSKRRSSRHSPAVDFQSLTQRGQGVSSNSAAASAVPELVILLPFGRRLEVDAQSDLGECTAEIHLEGINQYTICPSSYVPEGPVTSR